MSWHWYIVLVSGGQVIGTWNRAWKEFLQYTVGQHPMGTFGFDSYRAARGALRVIKSRLSQTAMISISPTQLIIPEDLP